MKAGSYNPAFIQSLAGCGTTRLSNGDGAAESRNRYCRQLFLFEEQAAAGAAFLNGAFNAGFNITPRAPAIIDENAGLRGALFVFCALQAADFMIGHATLPAKKEMAFPFLSLI
jgi:hypothetical protein